MKISNMELIILINAIIQSAIQSLFLVYYYRPGHRLKCFLWLMGIFNLILLPLDQLFKADQIMIKNILNMLILIFSCRWIFKQESWGLLLSGIIAYELILVLCVFVLSAASWILFHTSLETWTSSIPRTAISYLIMDILIFLVSGLFLHVFSREFSSKVRENKYVFSILFSIIFCALCVFSLSAPRIDKSHLWVDYFLACCALIIINVLSFSGFVHFLKLVSQKKAMKQIQEAYKHQVEDYLLNHEEEKKLRKLRHDLLNFLDAAENCDPNKSEQIHR